MTKKERIILHFPQDIADQPIIYNLSRKYDLEFNILKAYITQEEGGLMVLELSGENANYKKGIRYLKDIGLTIQALSQDIVRNEQRCSHCGACVTVCPTHSFEVDVSSRKVNFLHSKCVACGLCVKACPIRAMEMKIR